MHRKRFIKTCGLLSFGGSILSIALESCGTLQYFAQYAFAENKITVKKTEFLLTKTEEVKQRKFVLIKSDKLEYPVCIFMLDENEYTALYMQCTHRGCELKPNGNYLVCPCHGSEFSNKGIVQNPPAENNLKQFQITTDDENIYILL